MEACGIATLPFCFRLTKPQSTLRRRRWISRGCTRSPEALAFCLMDTFNRRSVIAAPFIVLGGKIGRFTYNDDRSSRLESSGSIRLARQPTMRPGKLLTPKLFPVQMTLRILVPVTFGAIWSQYCPGNSNRVAGRPRPVDFYVRQGGIVPEPQSCANCHVMQDNYSAWLTSSHHAVATCNDCHSPHNLVGKYAIKATNGLLHSLAFTTGAFPDVILIKGYNERVTESTCKDCHAELTSSIIGVHSGRDISCIQCHFDVGHSAAPISFTSLSPASSTSETRTPSSEESKNGKSEQR